MALFGGTTTKQAPLYTRKVNRARLEAKDAPLSEIGRLRCGVRCMSPTWLT
jgi:hypothetical protein